MKTFEAEKGNIPEGATGYREQGIYIEWFSGEVGCWRLIASNAPSMDMCETSKPVKPIPQTKEVEWVNGLPPVGVECNFTPHNTSWGFNYIEDFSGAVLHYEGEQFVFMLSHAKYKLEGEMVIVSRTDKGDFSKPETEAERKERERLEAAYDLYVECGGYADPFSFKQFCKPGTVASQYLAIVDKTNYRVDGE